MTESARVSEKLLREFLKKREGYGFPVRLLSLFGGISVFLSVVSLRLSLSNFSPKSLPSRSPLPLSPPPSPLFPLQSERDRERERERERQRERQREREREREREKIYSKQGSRVSLGLMTWRRFFGERCKAQSSHDSVHSEPNPLHPKACTFPPIWFDSLSWACLLERLSN